MPQTPPSLDAQQLGAYFALMDVASLLRHAVEQQLKDAGDLSYVQFQLLARLGDSPSGSQRMTELADGVVYSRSGLTYQADLLEKAGLVTRAPSPEDDRGTTVALTEAGRERLAAVFPGHVEVVQQLLLAPLAGGAGDGDDDGDDDGGRDGVRALAELLGPVREHMRTAPPRSAARRRRTAR